MLLIYTDYTSFDDYLSRLSKPARKNFKYVQKHNEDLVYESIPFDRDLVERFMGLWERQLIRGKNVQWAFPIGHVENVNREGRLRCFQARKENDIISVHFVESRGNYFECHPPLYDKAHAERYLAKFMWFSLVRYAIENKWPMLDMGGGPDDWREHIRDRGKYPNPQYKWLYVPEEVKKNPNLQPNYVRTENGIREAD